MALISSPSSANRIVDTALCITYARRKIYGSWTHETTSAASTTYHSAWEYTRTATKNYRYVGMTEQAATDLAAALVSYYTRSTKITEWDSWNGAFEAVDAGTVPMADVVCQHEDGDMWSVQVSVNEEDTRTFLTAMESFTIIFATENLRSYDTGASAPT